jgi:hypothetical protein
MGQLRLSRVAQCAVAKLEAKANDADSMLDWIATKLGEFEDKAMEEFCKTRQWIDNLHGSIQRPHSSWHPLTVAQIKELPTGSCRMAANIYVPQTRIVIDCSELSEYFSNFQF